MIKITFFTNEKKILKKKQEASEKLVENSKNICQKIYFKGILEEDTGTLMFYIVDSNKKTISNFPWIQ